MLNCNYSWDTLESLLNVISEYIFYIDLVNDTTYCNKGYAEEFIGDFKWETIGKPYKNVSHDYSIYNIGRLDDYNDINGKKNIVYEAEIKKYNGTVILAEIRKILFLDKEYNIIGILGIIKDISFKREIEKLRDDFFSNIKHEFRTPLNIIFSSIQFLNNKCKLCEDNKQDDCKKCIVDILNIININSLRILKLSDNFIELTNIQNGNIHFNSKNDDIVRVVESICDDINKYKKFNDITLIFDTNIEEKVISFDRDKIEKVILNLISNAIKFNIHGGIVKVTITEKDDYIEVSVKDTGIGISSERLDSIFDSFGNIGNRLTKVSEGIGIGLALCKYLVEIHDGKITVNSKVGKGSEFTVFLPNRINLDKYLDKNYNKVDKNSMERIKMEFSDIYL